jgi:hypothetical protein
MKISMVPNLGPKFLLFSDVVHSQVSRKYYFLSLILRSGLSDFDRSDFMRIRSLFLVK